MPSQLLFLIISGLLVLVDALLLIVDFALYLLIIFIIHLALTIGLNYIFSKLYFIKIQQNVVIVKNIWREKHFDSKDLIDVDVVHFFIPLPLHAFTKFLFKKEKVIGVLPNRIKLLLSDKSMTSYVRKLKRDLIPPNSPSMSIKKTGIWRKIEGWQCVCWHLVP